MVYMILTALFLMAFLRLKADAVKSAAMAGILLLQRGLQCRKMGFGNVYFQFQILKVFCLHNFHSIV